MDTDQIVYQFRHGLDRIERDAEDAPGTREAYERHGLLLLKSERSLLVWNRWLSEYSATLQQLAAWRAEPVLPRRQLLETHTSQLAQYALEVASERTLDITSGTLNDNVTGLGAPLPFYALGWPTVLPSYHGFEAEVGHAYGGKVSIMYGFGAFTVNYRCTVAEIAGTRATLKIELDPKETWVTGRRVLLILKAAGSFTAVVDMRDRLPARQSGQVDLRFRTQWKEGNDLRSFEVGRFNQTFDYRRVLASFDEQNFRATAWTSDAFTEGAGR